MPITEILVKTNIQQILLKKEWLDAVHESKSVSFFCKHHFEKRYFISSLKVKFISEYSTVPTVIKLRSEILMVRNTNQQKYTQNFRENNGKANPVKQSNTFVNEIAMNSGLQTPPSECSHTILSKIDASRFSQRTSRNG